MVRKRGSLGDIQLSRIATTIAAILAEMAEVVELLLLLILLLLFSRIAALESVLTRPGLRPGESMSSAPYTLPMCGGFRKVRFQQT